MRESNSIKLLSPFEKLKKFICYNDFRFTSIIIFIYWVCIQLFLIGTFWGEPQYSDAGRYQELAWECYYQGAWYPTASQIQDTHYVFNPGYINMLILQLRLFDSLNYSGFISLFFNILIFYSVYSLVRNIISMRAGYLAVIFLCLMPSNYLSSVVTTTEVFDTALVYFALIFIKPSYLKLVIAAFFMVYAEYIRPSAILFLLSILLWMLYKRFNLHFVVTFFASFTLFFFFSSIIVTSSTSARQLLGSTGGVNLIMGANDDMTGVYCPSVFYPDKSGYLESHYDAYSSDSVWKSRAKGWIIDHPIKYIGFMPIKALRLWWQDEQWVGFLKSNYREGAIDLFHMRIPFNKWVLTIIMNIGYYLCILFSIIGLYWYLTKIKERKDCLFLIILLLPVILNSLMIMFTVAAPRYHFISNPIIILFACKGVIELCNKVDNSTVSC